MKDKQKSKGQKMNTQQSEDGRSMVELMAVLALMGVLSIGGIAGYTTAMMKYKVNEILAGVQERALAVSAYQGFSNRTAENLLEYEDKTLKGYQVSLYDKKIEGSDFAIQIKDVKRDLCEQIATQGLETAVLVRPNLCDDRDNNTLIFGFKNDLQGKKDRRGNPGELEQLPQTPTASESCTQQGSLRCNQIYMVEKCTQTTGGLYWLQKEMCLYGCSGGICLPRDCHGSEQKCWNDSLLLTCSNGQWQRTRQCLSACQVDHCGEDCSVSELNKTVCWQEGSDAKIYSCVQTGTNEYRYSQLQKTCLNTSCSNCFQQN